MGINDLVPWISATLRDVWNPIGVDVPEDEYEGYAPKIASMIQVGGRDRLELIASYLNHVETAEMEVRGSLDRCYAVAAALCAPFIRAGSDIDLDYLARIERLAHVVVEKACAENRFDVFSDAGKKSESEEAITTLARTLRFFHWAGDGCLDHD